MKLRLISTREQLLCSTALLPQLCCCNLTQLIPPALLAGPLQILVSKLLLLTASSFAKREPTLPRHLLLKLMWEPCFQKRLQLENSMLKCLILCHTALPPVFMQE